MTREELERKLLLAEASLRQAAERLEQAERRLVSVEEERAQILGESALAGRALADFEALVEQSRAELAAIEIREARDVLAEAVRARDRVIQSAATALDEAVATLEVIEQHRAAVAEAQRRLRSLDPDAPAAPPDEPDLLHEPWQRMIAAVRAEIDEELEADLVDAAARSQNPQAINSLPQHLRELALQRRQALLRESIRRQDSTRTS
jgi:hypothetical protein